MPSLTRLAEPRRCGRIPLSRCAARSCCDFTMRCWTSVKPFWIWCNATVRPGKTRMKKSSMCITARHYARDARRLLRPRRRLGALPGLVGVVERRVPFGVVGVIAPWNYPLTLAISDAIPAMMAGNCVVVKPDVQTTLSALWIADLLQRAGLPPGVFSVVAGEGSVVGPLVIDRSDYVMFTGSTAVGRRVAARCGELLIGCSMELGGKNAMIVRGDADIAAAAALPVGRAFPPGATVHLDGADLRGSIHCR